MAKRNRVEEALGSIDVASRALRELRHELADVHARVDVPAGLAPPSAAWTFDVWFDNIFSDIGMQHRIEATTGSVDQLQTSLRTVRAALTANRQQLVTEESTLRRDASALLATGGPRVVSR
jgi:ribosomal protein L29